ncbi:MAG: cation diffusion facilitator family transporter [Chlamydiota bacterium]|nr:cation diffusion facilitator family transporter [Chlamydiota bacterium]
MHQDNIESWQHHHTFNVNKEHIEKKTLVVVIITFITMLAEIVFGLITNSMALFADGVHMGTHAFALGLSLFAYIFARKHAKNEHFTFGTWKIEILGAYSSALVLGMVAMMMVYSSMERLIHPLVIHYNQALFVAVIGLAVNVICALILNAGSDVHAHNDLNLKSAYIHVITDAMTSIFAIIALIGAKYYSLNFLDPMMGIVGALLITRWASLLLKDSAQILLDYKSVSPLTIEIRELIESDGDTRISDLHVWKVADHKYACIISLVTGKGYLIEDYKERLKNIRELAHITIEKNECMNTGQ